MLTRSMFAGLACLSIFLATASAATYSGSLSYSPPAPPDTADGLKVEGVPTQWPTYSVNMSWTVTDTDTSHPGSPWKYSYTFGHTGGQGGLSHIIIETSPGFLAGDIVDLTGATVSSIGLQTVASGNEGMPENLNGIRLNPITDGPFSMAFEFFSDRAPVWGDFYARCGNKQNLGVNRAVNYNMDQFAVERGFLDPDGIDSTMNDTDPLAAPSNGSIDFHILRPDSIPEPATLSMIALGALAMLRRRK